ncbi:hypothetical protein Bpfe_016788 [Biomphalaria pfeifferi]|uniref:Uncharacterized protein n=1 Tax=Biomphalaria pfeifferi TaxID=112525 RepID=A0AAD8F8D9_BIOPF|nr:hypothetical protein Bpfe_016788 [Biomphalaria pfeifferi]
MTNSLTRTQQKVISFLSQFSQVHSIYVVIEHQKHCILLNVKQRFCSDQVTKLHNRMNLPMLTISLLCLFCFILGAELNKRDQTSSDLKDIQKKVVGEAVALDEANVGTLEKNKKDLVTTLRYMVSAFCLALNIVTGRSVRSGQDLNNELDTRGEKRVVPIIIIGKVLCAANTVNNVYNAAKTFCRQLNGKRDTEYINELVEREELSREEVRRDTLSDHARNICSWLQSNGILRDTENQQVPLAENYAERRESVETRYI